MKTAFAGLVPSHTVYNQRMHRVQCICTPACWNVVQCICMLVCCAMYLHAGILCNVSACWYVVHACPCHCRSGLLQPLDVKAPLADATAHQLHCMHGPSCIKSPATLLRVVIRHVSQQYCCAACQHLPVCMLIAPTLSASLGCQALLWSSSHLHQSC